MARIGALFDENEALVTAAVIAAEATGEHDGFRQRDVRFFIELFSNWLESTTGEHALALHNTQVQRHLDILTKAKWARRVGRTPPRWHLTPEGLAELLRRLVHRRNLTRLDEFFLVFHFVDAYGARLRAIAEKGGLLASKLLLHDVTRLLDPGELIRRERECVARELARLAVRSEESRLTGELSHRRLAAGAPLAEVIREIEQRYPYELNSQKPLRELLAALPVPWQREEISEIAGLRSSRFWEPLRRLLEQYDAILEALEREPREEKSHPARSPGRD
jgi:hypothetical protein